MDEEIDDFIKTFYHAQKPIGAMCGAILLIGKSLSNNKHKIKLCMNHHSFIKVLEELNATIVDIKATESCIDFENKIVTTPAFLGTQNLFEMMIGIDDMVKNLIHLHESK